PSFPTPPARPATTGTIAVFSHSTGTAPSWKRSSENDLKKNSTGGNQILLRKFLRRHRSAHVPHMRGLRLVIDHDTVSPSGPWILKQPVSPRRWLFSFVASAET